MLDLIENEGVDIIIGAVSSPVTLEIAPLCEEQEVLLLSPSSSAPRISEAGEYIFRNYPSDILEGTAMADFAQGSWVRRVVIIALDNEFGSGLSEVFTRRFESKSRVRSGHSRSPKVLAPTSSRWWPRSRSWSRRPSTWWPTST